MSINFTLDMTREQVIERLIEQRALAIKFDKQLERDHRKEEQEYLKTFRAALREAAKWDYPTAKENEFTVERLMPGYDATRYNKSRRPQCPQAMTPQFDKAIRQFELVRQKSMSISSDGKWRQLHRLLTWSPDPIDDSATVC